MSREIWVVSYREKEHPKAEPVLTAFDNRLAASVMLGYLTRRDELYTNCKVEKMPVCQKFDSK